jgi:hypothetical protein
MTTGHGDGDSASQQLPHVDFSRRMLLVASDGSKPEGGYGIAVESVYESRSDIKVTVLAWEPEGCFVIMVVRTRGNGSRS